MATSAKELFDMNDGGDVFSSSWKSDSKSIQSALVFTVLYYCLSDGFIGKFGQDPAKAAAFKSACRNAFRCRNAGQNEKEKDAKVKMKKPSPAWQSDASRGTTWQLQAYWCFCFGWLFR